MVGIPVPVKYKRPGEIERFTFSFKDSLGTGETITGTPTFVFRPAEGLTVDSQANSTNEVQLYLTGGNDKESYIVKCLAVTTDGQELESDIKIVIEKAAA